MATKTIEEVLTSYLIGQGVHCYPNVKKESDNLCVAYRKISTIPYRTHNKTIPMQRSHFLLSAYGTSYSAVRGLVKTLWEKLDMNTSNFATAWISNEQDIADVDSKLYRVDLDLWVMWNDGNLV